MRYIFAIVVLGATSFALAADVRPTASHEGISATTVASSGLLLASAAITMTREISCVPLPTPDPHDDGTSNELRDHSDDENESPIGYYDPAPDTGDGSEPPPLPGPEPGAELPHRHSVTNSPDHDSDIDKDNTNINNTAVDDPLSDISMRRKCYDGGAFWMDWRKARNWGGRFCSIIEDGSWVKPNWGLEMCFQGAKAHNWFLFQFYNEGKKPIRFSRDDCYNKMGWLVNWCSQGGFGSVEGSDMYYRADPGDSCGKHCEDNAYDCLAWIDRDKYP